MTSLAIFGSTGSIGKQTLDVVRADRDSFDVKVLAAGNSSSAILEQIKEFQPELVIMADPDAAEKVRDAASGIKVTCGESALREAASIAQLVVNAVVDFAGLPVTMEALKSGSRLALANKESLIAAGPVVQKVRGTSGSELIPVDSEHCALHQCLHGENSDADEIHKLLVTASGGPFREWRHDDLIHVRKEDALKHPTWNMGPKKAQLNYLSGSDNFTFEVRADRWGEQKRAFVSVELQQQSSGSSFGNGEFFEIKVGDQPIGFDVRYV